MSAFSRVSRSTLLVIVPTAFLLASVVCQDPPISEVIPTSSLPELPCVNGESFNGSCVCSFGWTGELCDTCIRGRIKLVDDSGLIFDGSESYEPLSQCLFYIEANSSVSAIHLRFRSFHTECQWDSLSVFQGDSIFKPKIAAYTGDIIEIQAVPPTMPVDPQNSNTTTPPPSNTTAVPPQDDSIKVPYQDPKEITLSASGSQLLLYFYTDAGAQRPGFEVAYWVDYACPDNCSGNGLCENGTCVCDPEYTGQFCHLPVCPNNCSGSGVCDSSTQVCLCTVGYTGPDCAITVSSPHWERVNTSPLPENLTLATIARASHSAVLWGTNSEYMLVYGGYQFPIEDYYFRPRPQEMNNTMSNSSNDTNSTFGDLQQSVQLLRYHFESRSWDQITTYAGMPTMGGDVPGNNSSNETNLREEEDNLPRVPEPRYGHTAVIYNNTMYVFGGALLPTEQISNELWALDLTNLTWTIVPAITRPPSNFNGSGTENNAGGNTVSMETSDAESASEPLPLPVRSHTAHVIGNKMVTLFGLSSGRTVFLSYVQVFDFDTEVWSLPAMSGATVVGRMGHSSSYDQLSGLIYVHGGALISRGGVGLLPGILTLDPSAYSWSILTESGPPRFLHSSVFMGPLFLTFGGCETDANERDCFKNDLHIYNTLCDSWESFTYPGLPGNSSRYGHSSVVDGGDGSLLVFGGYLGSLHHDLLKLQLGNCSQYENESVCVNSTGLCAWSLNGTGECVSVGSGLGGSLAYQCEVDPCLSAASCSSCSLTDDCLWNSTLHRCMSLSNSSLNISSASCPVDTDACNYFTRCDDCLNHECSWGKYNNSDSVVGCVDTSLPQDSAFLDSPCIAQSPSCFSRTSCGDCTAAAGSCLWCASLNQCVPSYPLTYVYAQCLGWLSRLASCPTECSSLQTCDDCQNETRCGWCNDPSNTGLGRCIDGGFTSPRDTELCDEVDLWGREDTWHFYQCPACQCNGHSSCVNGSICEQCDNNTTGDTCSRCDTGYFGNPSNGGNCSECDCNGYNPVCDHEDGSCVCLSIGVGGTFCEQCEVSYEGEADNFCYSSLDVGFIYTFSATEDREVEGFFAVTPPEDKSLHFRIDVTSNPSEEPLFVQLFVGKLSENVWLLANITDPIVLNVGQAYDVNLEGFRSNSNSSFSQLFSFTNSKIRSTPNFTELLSNNSENQYTSQMWDGDVTLIIYLANLTNPSAFRLTVDQQDYVFLLYFFATFITCFSVLLIAFLVGWYIKRRLETRAYMRQQYIELQRRVARPFARIRAVIKPVPVPTPDSPPPPQHPSYVGVETCRNGKSAVLSLFVRLPGSHKTGKPCPGRSGLAIGSTLVNVNSSSKKDKLKRKNRRESSSDNDQGHTQRGTGSGIRLREVSSLTTNT